MLVRCALARAPVTQLSKCVCYYVDKSDQHWNYGVDKVALCTWRSEQAACANRPRKRFKLFHSFCGAWSLAVPSSLRLLNGRYFPPQASPVVFVGHTARRHGFAGSLVIRPRTLQHLVSRASPPAPCLALKRKPPARSLTSPLVCLLLSFAFFCFPYVCRGAYTGRRSLSLSSWVTNGVTLVT